MTEVWKIIYISIVAENAFQLLYIFCHEDCYLEFILPLNGNIYGAHMSDFQNSVMYLRMLYKMFIMYNQLVVIFWIIRSAMYCKYEQPATHLY